MHVNRNTSAVVDDRSGTIGFEKDMNLLTMTGDGFVDGVIDNFFEKMMKAARVGGANIHTRTFADRFETFENFDIFGLIVGHGLLCMLC